MENFTDIKLIYNHLEKNAISYRYSNEIANLFIMLRDLKIEERNSPEADIAQWEIDFFNFTLTDGELKPTFVCSSNEGEIINYPTLNRFSDRTYEYLIERLMSTSNPLLLARYSHILWCSPRKNNKFGRLAVDSYLELIKTYEAKDNLEPNEHYGLEVLNAIKNAYIISCQTKYRKETIKLEIKRLITSFNFKSSSSYALRINLIELMLKNKRRFCKEDFFGFDKICLQVSDSLKELGNTDGAIRMLELGERIDKKTERRTFDWGKQIAELYESLMEEAEKQNNFVAITYCQTALERYKKLKDKDKIRELEKKLSELEKSIKLSEFKKTIDITDIIKRSKEIAKEIVKEDSEEIIKFLMLNKNILPKYSDLEKIAEEQTKEFAFLNLFPDLILDQYGHTAQHFDDESEKKYLQILELYRLELGVNKINLINEIFYTAIQENKLSINILLDFLHKHSWFGKNISKGFANKTIQYNWLSLLAPSLNEYFFQLQSSLSYPSYSPNLVLCIDSLTLKIEGLIRDICQFSGVATFYITNDAKGRAIIREKDLHSLLYEEPIKNLFDQDDLLFFKFLLVEKAGYNLRHKVAHSLMLFQEYNINYMHLLILAILKLGKYDFVKQDNSLLKNDEKENY